MKEINLIKITIENKTVPNLEMRARWVLHIKYLPDIVEYLERVGKRTKTKTPKHPHEKNT